MHWHLWIGSWYWPGWNLKPWWDAGHFWPRQIGHWPDYRHTAFRDQLEPAGASIFIGALIAGPAVWKYRISGWQVGVRLTLLLVAAMCLGVLGVYLRDFGLPGLWAHTAAVAGRPGYTLDGSFSWAGKLSPFTMVWGFGMGYVLRKIWGPAAATIQGYWIDRLADRGRDRRRPAWYVRWPVSWPTFRERYSQLYLDSSVHLARPGRTNRFAFMLALLVVVLLIALGATGKWVAGHGTRCPTSSPGSHSLPPPCPAGRAATPGRPGRTGAAGEPRRPLRRSVIMAAAVHNRCGTVHGEEAAMADPDAEWWTMADIAEHWGVEPGTIQDYRNQTRHPRRDGQAAKLPPEDSKFGRTPVWRPETIISFKRPGRGHGGGRKPRAPEPGQPGSSPGDGAPRRRGLPQSVLPGKGGS